MFKPSMRPRNFKNSPMARTANRLRTGLGARAVVLIGLMGAGKSTIGKRVATMLNLPFFDADQEIEAASQMTISELFAAYGEEEFRNLERRVILRLLTQGPMVLATGGGAYMNEEIRQAISDNGISVWLNADIEVLIERVLRRKNRPLLNDDDPRTVMQQLMEKRSPVYAKADICVIGHNNRRDIVARDVVRSVHKYLLQPVNKQQGHANENGSR